MAPQTMTELEAAIRTEADAIAQIARDADPVVRIDLPDDDGDTLRTHVYDRDGGLTEVIDTEPLRDVPRAKRAVVDVHTPEALVTYANRHLETELSTLWADVDSALVTVILNDHEDAGDAPGWADHQARLKLRHSPEWKAWTHLDGQWVGQTELAEFLEEHLADIVNPDGATMLEVTSTFHATTGARFKRAQSTHSGEVQLTYEEEVSATAGKAAETPVPREFTLRLRPFVGVDAVQVRGQFRYRVNGGTLALGIRLLNVEDVVREAVDDVVVRVSDELVLPPIHGTAPSPRR